MDEYTKGYPFIFQMNDNDGTDELLETTLQYRFKSSKSHHTYIVRVEKYIKHCYCLKFFDKANINFLNMCANKKSVDNPLSLANEIKDNVVKEFNRE